MERIIVEDLSQVDYSDMKVPMAVIYNNPADISKKFVVRLWEAATGQLTNVEVHADTLMEARRAILKSGLLEVCIPRAEVDDPVIVESWI